MSVVDYRVQMGVRYITQDRIEQEGRALARSAERTLDVASPWIEPYPVQRLLSEVLPRVRAGDLKVRIVYRVSEESDLRITDLSALEALAAEGVQIRYSRRLHAKLVIADRARVLVGSSNLTRRGGYGYRERPHWRNEEAGMFVEDPEAVGAGADHFDAIWEDAGELTPPLVGVVMDFPSVREFSFVAIREVSVGQLVVADDGERRAIGEVVSLTAYNQSFPQMTEEMFLTQGFGGAPPRRVALPDLPTLFSHPIKDHGFLVAKTYLLPESAFEIANVQVLRALADGEPESASAPVAPGSDVMLPSSGELRRLLGDGDVRLGRMARHPEVGVWLRSSQILSTHLAILGMTGSGKSNGAKHLVRQLRPSERGLRVIVIDTHGEYAEAAADLDPVSTLLDVSIPDKINLLDFDMVRDHFSVERMTAQIKKGLRDTAAATIDPVAFGAALAASSNDVLQEIAAAVSAAPDAYCVGTAEPRIVVAGTGEGVDLAEAGVYVLDLRETDTFAVRSRKCGVLVEHVFRDAKRTRGAQPTLLVVDEAHNYVPERTTGFMGEAARHGSLHALTDVAVEGRKFAMGLVVVSQRPSRIAKDVLAQMSSQLVFRLANLEDLAYVRESFEAAGSTLMSDLPHLDTGVCICAGTMVDMPVRCDVPLFARRWAFDLDVGELPSLEALGRAVEAVIPRVEPIEDAAEEIVFAGPQAEVVVRALDDGYALDVDCVDDELAERVRDAVEHALPPVPPISRSASAELPEDS